MRRILCTIALTLALCAPTFSQAPPDPPSSKVDKIFAQWDRPDVPGCAAAVVKDGQVVHKRAYGSANLELAAPLSPSTVFNAGSISKQFTAMSVLMLARQGKLSLEDDVRKHVPEVPDFGTPVRLRHLLQHTSGLRDFPEMLEMKGWRTGGDLTTEKDVLDMVARQRTLNHEPGREFVYTNTGYVLLAVVVRRVSGKPLREFAEENIFKPLGMSDTRFRDDHTAVVRNRADAYLPVSGGGFKKWMPADDHAGSSNLYTTVEDLARWDQNFYDTKVGGPEVVAQMLAPGALDDGPKHAYAGGLYVSSYAGRRLVYHLGSTLGYQGALYRFPDERLSVALLCNVRGNNPDALARKVADVYLTPQPAPPASAAQPEATPAPENAIKVSAEELEKVAGLYWNPSTDAVRRVYVKDGRLMYSRPAGNESELAPLGANRFRMLGVRNRVEVSFQTPRPGAPLQMLFAEGDAKPAVSELVRAASHTPRQLEEFAGEYYSPEVDATYRLAPRGGGLLFSTGNWGEFLLSPRFADSFANPEEMGSIIFTRDGRGRVDGFRIRSGKVRNLRFDKIRQAPVGRGR